MQFLGRLAKFWVPLAIILLCLFLAYNNRAAVHLSLWPWMENVDAPGFLVFMGFFLLGAGMMTAYYMIDSVRKGLTIRRLTKRVRELEDSRGLTDDLHAGAGRTAVPREPSI